MPTISSLSVNSPSTALVPTSTLLDSPSIGATGANGGRYLPGMPKLTRGYACQYRSDGQVANPNARYNFQFNPTSISTTISFNTASPPNIVDVTPPDVSAPSTAQVSLYIDRQDEVATPGKVSSNFPSLYAGMGAAYDLQYIWRLFGINAGVDIGPGVGGGADSSGIVATNIQIPGCKFVFGPYLQLVGFLVGLGVEYIKFDSNMTPTVITVAFTLQVVYNGILAPATSISAAVGGAPVAVSPVPMVPFPSGGFR